MSEIRTVTFTHGINSYHKLTLQNETVTCMHSHMKGSLHNDHYQSSATSVVSDLAFFQ